MKTFVIRIHTQTHRRPESVARPCSRTASSTPPSNPAEGGNPHIVALDQANDQVLFDTTLPGGVPGAIVTDGRLLVATNTGDVLACQGPDS